MAFTATGAADISHSIVESKPESGFNPKPKALIFDLMGTCLDWHSSILSALAQAMYKAASNHQRPPPSKQDVSDLALDWRQGFFDEIHARFEAGESMEDIDITHRRALERLLKKERWQGFESMAEEDLGACVDAWHGQQGELSAWADGVTALPKLRDMFDIIVLANGTTRLQIDITKSSGLTFDMLLSSELLGITKPDPRMYQKAMSLMRFEPDECIMVAAHAYDLRAAQNVGMRTVYLQRWTEDPREDMAGVKAENDLFIDSRNARVDSGGLLTLLGVLRGTDLAAA